MLKDEITERAVIRPIAEAAWDNRHDLPTHYGLCYGQRNKGRIQIYRLDTDTAQGQPMQ